MSSSSHPFLHSNNSENFYSSSSNQSSSKDRHYFLDLEDEVMIPTANSSNNNNHAHNNNNDNNNINNNSNNNTKKKQSLQHHYANRDSHEEIDPYEWWEKCLERVIIILVFCLIGFVGTVFYYDSLSINRINSILVFHSLFSPSTCHQIIHLSELYAKEHSWTTSRHRNYPTTDIPLYYMKDYNITLLQQQQPTTPQEKNNNNNNNNNNNIHQIPQTVSYPFLKWLNETIEKEIFPLISDGFQIPIEQTFITKERKQGGGEDGKETERNKPTGDIYELYCKDLFIVKYDAEHEFSQKHLAEHTDSSYVSFNIALSPPDDEVNEEGNTGSVQMEKWDDSDLSKIKQHSFRDGGTKFYLSNRIIVNPIGSIMIHNSKIYHEGVKISKGKRYIIVGFVNIRKKPSAKEPAGATATSTDIKPKETRKGILERVIQPFRSYYWYYHSIYFARKFGAYSHCMELVTYSPRREIQPIDDPYFHLSSTVHRLEQYHFIDKTKQECVNWFYPYLHALYHTLHYIFFKSDGRGGIKKYLQQGTVIFIALAILLALFALLMLGYEYCTEYYFTFRNKQKMK